MGWNRYLVIVGALVLWTGCATQQEAARMVQENRELRRLLVETRETLDEVKRDQEQLRAELEYLQYAQRESAEPDETSEAGLGSTAGEESTENAARQGAASDFDVFRRQQLERQSKLGGQSREPLEKEPEQPPAAGGQEPPEAGGEPQEAVAPQGSAATAQGQIPSTEGFLALPGLFEQAARRDNSASAGGPVEAGARTEQGLVAVPGAEPELPHVPFAMQGSGYEEAVRAFVEHRFDDAIQSFRDFVYKHPSSGYADDAQYWIGECYLRQRAYASAIKEFNQVVLRYRSGDQGAAALLKLAGVFATVGDQVDARLSLHKLVRLYPSTAEAARAAVLLENMGG